MSESTEARTETPQRSYFGTDGVRGTYGGAVVCEAFFKRIGAAAARWLKGRGVPGGRVLFGRDTRDSGLSLADAAAAGFASQGFEPESLGVLPTPAVARAVCVRGAVLGAVVTASHNPASDNGIKFFGPDGCKLTDEQESEIESLLPPLDGPSFGAERSGFALSAEGSGAEYVGAAAELLPAQALRGWRVVIDTANGATSATSPAVFRRLGAEVFAIGDRPDGKNINSGVGSEHPALLAERVVAFGACLGVAHDGDGDRCVLCDERGGILDGDEILAILATHALARGRLTGNLLVVTVQSNLGVDAAVAAAGGRVVRVPVGDRYVAERMRATGAILGGESSGHILCFDAGPTGDGLAAALKVAGVMVETGKPLSELRAVLRRFPQATAALRVRSRPPLDALPTLPGVIRALESELGASGRVLVRYSGTESKLRLLIEGPEEGPVREGLARLSAAASADLGAF